MTQTRTLCAGCFLLRLLNSLLWSYIKIVPGGTKVFTLDAEEYMPVDVQIIVPEDASLYYSGGYVYAQDNTGLWGCKLVDAPPNTSFQFVDYYNVPPYIRKQSGGGANAM